MRSGYHVDRRFAGDERLLGKTDFATSLEIIYGKRRAQQYWELTTDPETLPKNATWCDFLTKYHQVGNLYGLRNWVEYGLKQSNAGVGMGRFSSDKLCPD